MIIFYIEFDDGVAACIKFYECFINRYFGLSTSEIITPLELFKEKQDND